MDPRVKEKYQFVLGRHLATRRLTVAACAMAGANVIVWVAATIMGCPSSTVAAGMLSIALGVAVAMSWNLARVHRDGRELQDIGRKLEAGCAQKPELGEVKCR